MLDQTVFSGEWKNGLRHGFGSFQTNGGQILVEGAWKNGKEESTLKPFQAAAVKKVRRRILCFSGLKKITLFFVSGANNG